ncbi:MAG TPA: Hpt domain-containing protein [Gemmatimonadaceae bacterium]|nr:Hpt domain-containing protein [Gemmatimonadaceae bacterium]
MSDGLTPRFDPDAITRLRRFGGDPLLFQMIDLLTAAAPKRLDVVRDALASGDAEPARSAFHALKSSAGQLGAGHLQALCEQGELLAARGDLAGVSALLPELDAEHHAVREWLAGIRQGDE